MLMVQSNPFLASPWKWLQIDVNKRTGKSWAAMDNLSTIRKSNLPKNIKRNFFKATVATTRLLYEYTAWTLTKRLEKKID